MIEVLLVHGRRERERERERERCVVVSAVKLDATLAVINVRIIYFRRV